MIYEIAYRLGTSGTSWYVWYVLVRLVHFIIFLVRLVRLGTSWYICLYNFVITFVRTICLYHLFLELPIQMLHYFSRVHAAFFAEKTD